MRVNAGAAGRYENGLWTPTLTFATPGDLAVAYSQRVGEYFRIGNLVILTIALTTSSFTHTTASGSLRFTGLPFVVAAGPDFYGSLAFSGWTHAASAYHALRAVQGQSYLDVPYSQSAGGSFALGVGQMPTGGVVNMQGQVMYEAA